MQSKSSYSQRPIGNINNSELLNDTADELDRSYSPPQFRMSPLIFTMDRDRELDQEHRTVHLPGLDDSLSLGEHSLELSFEEKQERRKSLDSMLSSDQKLEIRHRQCSTFQKPQFDQQAKLGRSQTVVNGLGFPPKQAGSLKQSLMKMRMSHLHLLKSIKCEINSESEVQSEICEDELEQSNILEEEKQEVSVKRHDSQFSDLPNFNKGYSAVYNSQNTQNQMTREGTLTHNSSNALYNLRQGSSRDQGADNQFIDSFRQGPTRNPSISLNNSLNHHVVGESEFFLKSDFAKMENKLERSLDHKDRVRSDLKAMANMAAVLGMDDLEMKSYCWVGSRALFSAKVQVIKIKESSEKRILIFQGSFLYFFERESHNLISSIPIALLQKVELVRHSSLVMLSIKNHNNLLLEMTPRVELLLFLTHHFARMKIKPPLMHHSNFITSGPNQFTQLKFSPEFINLAAGKGKKCACVMISSTDHKSASQWEDAVIVLTKVGLKVYESFMEKEGTFYPLFNSKVSSPEIKESQDFSQIPFDPVVDDKKAVLKIQLVRKGEIVILFYSQAEGDSWYKEIVKLQVEYKEEEKRSLFLF